MGNENKRHARGKDQNVPGWGIEAGKKAYLVGRAGPGKPGAKGERGSQACTSLEAVKVLLKRRAKTP